MKINPKLHKLFRNDTGNFGGVVQSSIYLDNDIRDGEMSVKDQRKFVLEREQQVNDTVYKILENSATEDELAFNLIDLYNKYDLNGSAICFTLGIGYWEFTMKFFIVEFDEDNIPWHRHISIKLETTKRQDLKDSFMFNLVGKFKDVGVTSYIEEERSPIPWDPSTDE